MSQKKPNDIIFKELGSLQEKVLFYLAENPENHKQGIQQGIDHPAEQYGSVKKAVDTLEELGYIDSKATMSQKKVEIKIYNCTESGLFYALTKNYSANIPKILEEYKTKVEFCKSFRKLYDVWGYEHFIMYLRDVGEFLPMIQKNGIEQALPYLFVKAVKHTHNMDPKTRKKNIKESLKISPETRKMLEELKKNINEVLSNKE